MRAGKVRNSAARVGPGQGIAEVRTSGALDVEVDRGREELGQPNRSVESKERVKSSSENMRSIITSVPFPSSPTASSEGEQQADPGIRGGQAISGSRASRGSLPQPFQLV